MKYQSLLVAALTMSVAAASPLPKGKSGGSSGKGGSGGKGGSSGGGGGGGSSPKSSKPSPTKAELEPTVVKQTPTPPPPQQPTSSPKPTPTPTPQEPTSSPKPTPTPTPTPSPTPSPSSNSKTTPSSSSKASSSSAASSSSSSIATPSSSSSSSSASIAGSSSSSFISSSSSSFVSGSSSSSLSSSSALTTDDITTIISSVSSASGSVSSRTSTGLTATSTAATTTSSGLTSTGTGSASGSSSSGTHTGTETSTSSGTETITSMTSTGTETGTATSTTVTSSVTSTANPEYVPFSGAFPSYPVDGMAPPTEQEISSNKPNGVPDWVAPLIEKGIWNIATTGSLFGSSFNVTDGGDDGSGDGGVNNGDNSTSTDDGSGDGGDDGDNGDGSATNGTATTGPYYNGTSATSSLVGTGTAAVPVPLNTASALYPTIYRRGKGKNNGGKGGKGGKGDELQCPTKWEDTVEHMKPMPKRDEAMFFSNAGKDTPSSFSRLNKKLVVAAAFNEAYTQKISNCPNGWEHASTAWAMVASGDVFVLMPALSAADRKNPKSWFNWPTNYKGGVSVWENYEWPYLVQNKNVCRIWRVDKSGLQSAVLLAVRTGGSCAPGTLGLDPVTGAQPATKLPKRVVPRPTAAIAL